MTEEDRERDYTDAWEGEPERDWHQEWKDDQMQRPQEEPDDWYDGADVLDGGPEYRTEFPEDLTAAEGRAERFAAQAPYYSTEAPF